jgi:hypothetical protein
MSAKVQVMSPWVQTLSMVKPWEGSPGGDKSKVIHSKTVVAQG